MSLYDSNSVLKNKIDNYSDNLNNFLKSNPELGN